MERSFSCVAPSCVLACLAFSASRAFQAFPDLLFGQIACNLSRVFHERRPVLLCRFMRIGVRERLKGKSFDSVHVTPHPYFVRAGVSVGGQKCQLPTLLSDMFSSSFPVLRLSTFPGWPGQWPMNISEL